MVQSERETEREHASKTNKKNKMQEIVGSAVLITLAEKKCAEFGQGHLIVHTWRCRGQIAIADNVCV